MPETPEPAPRPTPDPSPSTPAAAGSALRRGALGTADISFFVVSAAAPLTVMAGVAPVAILLGGIGAPAGTSSPASRSPSSPSASPP